MKGHTENGDLYLAKGTSNEVSASQLKSDSSKLSGIEEGATAGGGGHITILPSSYDSKSGVWFLTVNDTYYLNGIFANITANDGDNVSYKIYLPVGTYSLLLIANKNANGGIVDIDINETEFASFDVYNASQVQAYNFRETEIVISSAGLKELKLRMDGKNPSSSAYQLAFSYLALWRTS